MQSSIGELFARQFGAISRSQAVARGHAATRSLAFTAWVSVRPFAYILLADIANGTCSRSRTTQLFVV